jgi:hypothetical protein
MPLEQSDLGVISTRWETLYTSSQIFFQRLPSNLQLLTVLKNKYHSSPLSLACILPGVHGRSLNRDIPSLHELLLSTVKNQVNRSLKDNAVVQTLSSVHDALVSRGEVDDSTDCAVGVDQAELALGDDVVMRFDVGVIVEVGRELGGSVDDVEGHQFVVVDGPIARAAFLNDGFSGGGIVACEVSGQTGKIVLDLGWIGRSRRHLEGVFVKSGYAYLNWLWETNEV